MSDQTTNALLAIALGTAFAIVLFIPVAAVQYRLDGRLGPMDLAVLFGGAIYALALWTYTLLPVPPAGSYACKGAQTDVLAFVPDLRAQAAAVNGMSGLVRDPVFLQLALNVVLFLPLGFLVRWILGRGFVVSTVLGFGISLLIETTQRTGVWGLYDCAYRLFDVDDLVMNTGGALLGSVLSAIVIHRRHVRRALPTRLTFGRRVVGMVCDVLFIGLVGAFAAVAYRALPGPADRGTAVLLQWGVPAVVQAACVLLGGRTVGELVVSLRTTARRWTPLARLVKLVVGVGPLFALALVTTTGGYALLGGFLLLTLLAAIPGDHRGLSHALAGMDLRPAGAAAEPERVA